MPRGPSGIARAVAVRMANVKKIGQRIVAAVIMASSFAINCASPPLEDESSAGVAALEDDEMCGEDDDGGQVPFDPPADASAPSDGSAPRDGSAPSDAGGASDGGRAAADGGGNIRPLASPPRRPCRCKATSAVLAETPSESCNDDGSSKGSCLGGKDEIVIKCDCNNVCPRRDARYTHNFGGCKWTSTGDAMTAGTCTPVNASIEVPLVGAALALRYCGQACRR